MTQNGPYDQNSYNNAADSASANGSSYGDAPADNVPPNGTNYGGTPNSNYPNNPYPNNAYNNPYAGAPQPPTAFFKEGAVYPMTETDSTLRLIAFIFNLISLISVCWVIIPLAWMIPMTVRSWSIYKGTRPNTTAFGVCDLLFVSMVSGILLLCSKKEM